VKPDLDDWLPEASIRVEHSRSSEVDPDRLWDVARSMPLSETGRLGRLVRWRIPGLARGVTVEELFRQAPFTVLDEGQRALVSGLVGRIWTLRRDYPRLHSPEEFRSWDRRGTVRVAFANWVEEEPGGRSRLCIEARVQPLGRRGRMGMTAIGPLVRRFQPLVGSEGITAAVRAAEIGG
jgi:hypothetical protein